MQALRENPRLMRIILLGMFVLALACLVGVLIYNILYGEGGNGGVSDTPTPAPPAPTSEGPDVVVTPDEEPTPTPTRVIIEEPTEEPTQEPTTEPTEEPGATATPTKESSVDLEIPIISPGAITELLKNGDFEEGFDEQGAGSEWQSFKTDSVATIFSSETISPYIKSGAGAQRITMSQATQGNRYAGIYQQVNIVPSQPYTLELHGQIRTGFADVNLSSYGYRMQYAIDHNGGDNWRDVPEENWVELPWDEQLLNSLDVKFLDHTTEITSTSSQISLFVRAWNKWADPGEAQYTLDSLSLVGPAPTIGGSPDEEVQIDKPLPTTGAGDTSFMGNGRFWIAVLVLLLLAVGAIYRAKWSY
jgi:hypothetical protein